MVCYADELHCLQFVYSLSWQLVASMIVLVLSVVGGLWAAAKLLRIYLLMYGKRPRLRELVRALRAR